MRLRHLAVTRMRTISILFTIGSACFAVGAVPGYAGAAGATADGVTFEPNSRWPSAALAQPAKIRRDGS